MLGIDMFTQQSKKYHQTIPSATIALEQQTTLWWLSDYGKSPHTSVYKYSLNY
jgi:hypothetical protein